MRDYGKVVATFWTRGSGKSLRGDHEAQVVALYLMTCPQSTMIGLFPLALPTLAHDIGSPIEGATKALGRVCKAGIAFYDESEELIFVPKMAFYQLGNTLQSTDKRVKWVLAQLTHYAGHRFYWDFVAIYNSPYNLNLEAPPKPLRSPVDAPPKPYHEHTMREAGEKGGAGGTLPDTEPPPPSAPCPADVTALPPPAEAVTFSKAAKGTKGKPKGHETWLTPYLQAYCDVMSNKLKEPRTIADLLKEDIGAMARLLGKDPPTVEKITSDLDHWAAQLVPKDFVGGWTVIRSFKGWMDRQRWSSEALKDDGVTKLDYPVD